jgi:hypothetical protein
MQRYSFWRLFAWLVSFHQATRNRKSTHGEMTGALASPVLTFTAVALFLILAILEVDLHRDELRALGLTSNAEQIGPIPAGP